VEIRSFFAYAPNFGGGVVVAAGDIDGDLRADIITAAGGGAAPHVRAFRGTDLVELLSFFAFPPGYLGGVRLTTVQTAAGADIVASAASGATVVAVYDGRSGGLKSAFAPFDPSFLGGVFVGGG
jgi:hypothetical protein